MSTELVNVAVPRQHLSRVYGLIAQLDGKTIPVDVPEADDAPTSNRGTDEWTPARIRKMIEQSDAPMRKALQALASEPGQWISTEALAKAVGKDAHGKAATWNTIAGMFGAFGRRLKNRYGLETKPWERRYEHGVGKVYRMSKEIAQHVLQALKNGH